MELASEGLERLKIVALSSNIRCISETFLLNNVPSDSFLKFGGTLVLGYRILQTVVLSFSIVIDASS